MLHGLRRWAKITDSLLLPPLLLHEVIHVERERSPKAFRLRADRVRVAARRTTLRCIQKSRGPPDGRVYSERRVLSASLYLPCVAHALAQCAHRVTTKHALLRQENPKSAWYVLVLYLQKREQC